MPKGNAPVAQTVIAPFHIAIFDNGPDKPIGVQLQTGSFRGASRILIRPGHVKGLRDAADWIEQETARLKLDRRASEPGDEEPPK